MSLGDVFRARCPACNRRGLRILPDRSLAEAIERGERTTPELSWRRCPHCGAGFKRAVRGDDRLVPVTADELARGTRREPGSQR